MDKLFAMQTFVRVVETGGFSAVSRERNTSQSSVSKQIAALENSLGVKLLTRTTRSLTLTEDGEQYFEEVRRLISEVAEAEARLRHGEQQLRGLLRVAAPVAFGLRVLMPHVRDFLKIHPNIKIDLRLNDNVIDLVEQGVDVAVRIAHLSDSGLIARCIGESRAVLVASRSYLASLPDNLAVPKTPDELRMHACIVYTERLTKNAWTFTNALGESVSVTVNGPLQSNSSEAVRSAALNGLGIAYVPIWHFEDEIKSGEMQILLPDWPVPPLPIYLVCPSQRRQTAKVRAFSDYLVEVLKP
ncbi:LysR family transcriptional regulator [Undibacterium parvum]|uniref:LysR family transcriptional regulator n=2 Tax=Undibacterium TaxID=401469 RepID=A0A6M4A2D7_9BURK|nr:LysR family transcriptional regulator [Undibacterium parvum]AZP10885.1 LysR family transcriptional regulator [Undibacterium parvum]QJQ05461.1 LysR family transcriptional regulator [Undibacterium piscinae]